MVFIPAVGTYKVSNVYRNDDVIEMVNVFHVAHGIGSFHDNAVAIAGAVYSWYLASHRELLTATWRLESTEVRDVSVADGAVEIIATPAGFHGTSAGNPDVNGTAMTATWQTGFAGKSKRGRTYIGGLAREGRDEVNYTADFTALVQADMQAFYDAMVDNDSRLQVVSYFSAGAPRTSAQITEIKTVRCNQPVYRQWRRMTAP